MESRGRRYVALEFARYILGGHHAYGGHGNELSCSVHESPHLVSLAGVVALYAMSSEARSSPLIPVYCGWAGAFSGVALSSILGVKPLIHAPAVENAPSQPHSHSPTLPLAIFSAILHSEASKRRLIWRGK